MNFGNAVMALLIQSPLHFFVSGGMMLLTYTGNKSGRTIRVPISYQTLPDGSLQTTSLRSRTWWRNLRGGNPVILRLCGRDQRAVGLAVEDTRKVAAAFKAYFAQNPRMTRFYNVTLGADGQPEAGELARLANERVVIRFTLERGHAVQ